MDNNGTHISKIPRKTYSRELLRSLKNSELSNLWPKSLDKTCINSHNQWDPVKSFENNKTTDTKRNIFAESKSGYRNNDKSKDDISLRPERRRWNDGCQVTNNNKRNSDDSHSNSYRKSYQSTVPNCGGGDYDRSRFNRNTTRNSKLKENDTNIKENKTIVINNKPEKSSRNNSNLEERKEDKEDQQQKTNLSKNCNSNSRFSRNNEPEWFLEGPENCEETIELRGITANDNEMLHFKSYSSTSKPEESGASKPVISDGLMLNLSMDKPSVLTDNCISPKREGSRFQDIFLKEKIINNLNESKDVENILKAVLSDNVSKSDVERLNNVSKPLPNGVLTLEEIEKNMTSGSILMDRTASKSTTIDTLNSFEPSLKSLLSSALSSPSQDNSKVVNWLSGLNLHGKDSEMEKTPQYNDSHNFCCTNPMINPPNQLPAGYSKFIPTLQPPPGLPLVLNNNQLQQQHHQHQQQQQQQQSQMIQQQHQNKLLQSTALMKQLQMSQSNNMNHNIQSRNILPFMFPTHNPSNEFENFLNEKYKLHNQSANSMSNEAAVVAAAAAAAHIDQSVLSNYLMKNKHAQMNHNMINHDNRNHLLAMNGPPGLTNLNLLEKNMIMQPRPIVKTSTPQLFDTANMNDFNKNFPNNFLYHRNQLPTNNNNNNNNPPSNPPPPPPPIPSSHLPIHMRELLKQQQQQQQQESSSSLACRFADNINIEMNKCTAAAVQMNQIDVYNSMRNREILQKQAMLLHNNYPYRQSFIPPGAAHEMNMQNSSSNKMLANLFNVSSSTLPPLPQQAKYADQIETENI